MEELEQRDYAIRKLRMENEQFEERLTIKLVHPPGEELRFVVELPDVKQMTFNVDRHQIDSLAEHWH